MQKTAISKLFLKRFAFSLRQENALSLCLSAMSNRKCDSAFAEIALIIWIGFMATSGATMAQRVDNEQFILGVGGDHVLAEYDQRPGTIMPYVSMEIASKVLVPEVDLRTRLGVDASVYGAWIGIGPSIEFDVFDLPLYSEFSLMPGLWMDFEHKFAFGSFENGLGYPVQFRTQVGLGWHLSQTAGISAMLSHKSNANLPGAKSNPGMEAFQLRYTQSF